MRSIRMLVGVVAAALVLTPTTAPAQARSMDAGVDPAVLAAFRASVKASYYTAWAHDGGTYTDRCEGYEYGRSSTVIALDVKTRTKSIKYRMDAYLPTKWIGRGHTSYSKVPAAVRKSLRVHGVKPPARWVSKHSAYVDPEPDDELWSTEDEPPFYVEWDELSQAPTADGGATFTGSYESNSESESLKYVFRYAFTTDPSGRFLSYTSVTEAVTGTTVEQVATCVSRWTWSRPALTLPKHSGPNTLGRRLLIEGNAVSHAKYLAFRADQLLTQGSTTEEVVAWLHTQVKPAQQRAHGITYVERKKHFPPLRYKILVHEDTVTYQPIR